MRYTICLLLLATATLVNAQNKVEVTAQIDQRPIKIDFNLSLSDKDPYISLGHNNPVMMPALAIWNFGDKKKGEEIPMSGLTQHITHVFPEPGIYNVVVTVVDSKRRFIYQRASNVRVHPEVEINPEKETACDK